MVEDVGFEPLCIIPNDACYHYTTSSILVGTGEWSRTTVTSVSERHNNRYMTPAYTRRTKITYQFPKRMLIHKLLKPSLCTVSYIAAGVPASFESLFCSLGLTIQPLVRVRGLEPPEYSFLDCPLCHSSTPAYVLTFVSHNYYPSAHLAAST